VRDFRWIDPEFVSLVAAHRLDALEGPVEPDVTEGLITAHRGRVTIRRNVTCDDGSVRTVYVKREKLTPLRYQLAHLVAGRGLWSRARAEFEILRQLRAANIRCPRPIACAQRDWPLLTGVLVLEELVGSQPLHGYLASGDLPADHESRERFFTALGREVARLHAAGFRQPDLYSNHIHVLREGDGWGFAFLDFQRSVRCRRVSLRHRVPDLAALLATLPPRLAGQRDLEVFFDAYLANSGLEEQIGQVRTGVDQALTRLLTLRKIWEVRESDTCEHRAVERLEILQAGTMWIDRHYRPQLEAAGLANFAAMMSTSAGRLLRALPDRENWRLDLAHPEAAHSSGLRRGAYLKKHHVRTAGTRLRARLGAGPGDTPGRVEARNVARLARGGIAAMRLIAFGEKLHRDGSLQSFVLTEELVGYQQLDHFLRQRFAAPPGQASPARDRDLQRLIREVACVAARFHTMGYNHRDLYCCHFFIKENSPGEFHVNLIDLQRVQHRRRRRQRWIVKDLAQLAFSAPRDRIRCPDKMAFIKQYFGVRKLGVREKRLIRLILAKQHQMEHRHGPHP
jgi:heptose I phosphotransferase